MTQILSLILQLSGISTRRVAERLGGLSVLYVLSVVFLLLGITGLFAALWILLSRVMDPLLAALLMGSLSLIIAGCLLLAAKSRSNADNILYGRKAQPELPSAPDSLLLVVPLLIAALLGFAITRKGKD